MYFEVFVSGELGVGGGGATKNVETGGRGRLKWVIGKWNPDIACLDLHKTSRDQRSFYSHVSRSSHFTIT